MMHRGQLQLEAIVCLACFFALLGTALHGLNHLKLQGMASAASVAAKSNSLLCATLIDSMYSNSVDSLADEKLPCIAEDGEAKSSVEGREKSTAFIPENVKVVQAGDRTTVYVELNEHYR